MSKRQALTSETREQALTLKPRGQAGDIEPKGQAGDIELRRQARDIDPRGQAGDIEPRSQAGDIELRRQARDIEPRGQAGDIEPRGKAGDIAPREQAGDIEPRGKAGDIVPREQAETIESIGQARTINPSGQAGDVEPRGQAGSIEPRGQAGSIEPRGQAGSIEPSGQAGDIEPREKSVVIEPRGQAETIESIGQASTIKPSGQAGTLKSKRQAVTIELRGQSGNIRPKEKAKDLRWTEQASSSRSTKEDGTSKSKRQTGKTRSLSEKVISKDCASPLGNLNLSNFVDIQQLFQIGYRNPELLPLIKRIPVVGEVMRNFNPQVQGELIAMIKVIEKTIKEFVYMKNTSYNSDAVEETVYRLLPNLSKRFSNVVLKQGCFILDPAMRNMVEWKRISAKLSKKERKTHGLNLFDLSTRFQTKDLIEIGRDHPEFRTNIKTILGVNATMKHLNHEGQVEIYKILRRIENIIKDLVQEKTKPDGCHDIFLTPETLSSSLEHCIENILMHLKSKRKIPLECLQCEMDRSYVTNFHIKPDLGTLKRRRTQTKPVTPLQQSVFECANWGISPDRVKNLESLIHHLTAKKGAFSHAWLFENCIDWFEIASLFSAYRSKTRPDKARIESLKLAISQKLDRVEEVMVGARDFCARMRVDEFMGNETLSDAIALSGQIEMLASEVENYLRMLDLLVRNIFSYNKIYKTSTTNIQDNRLLFLTKTQWRAFDFPFY